MQRERAHAGWIATLALAGCAGNGEGLDQNGRPVGEAPPPLTADFDSIQQNVLTPVCTVCHSGAAAPLGLRLDAGISYAQLVDVPSVEVPGLARVAPGDPDASYLVQKLEGNAAVGDRMPLAAPPLPQATIDVIRQWIVEGASATVSVPVVAGPATLRAASPVAESLLAAAPRRIIVATDAELDTTRVHAGSVMLVRSGGDRSFDDGNESVIDGLGIDFTVLAPTVMVITPPLGSMTPDRYELRLAGTGAAAITDRNTVAIDGDADGQPGGDFVLHFDVGAHP